MLTTMEQESEADKEAVRKISSAVSRELAKQFEEKLLECASSQPDNGN